MAGNLDQAQLHHEMTTVGLRAQATAAGLVQLCKELVGAGVLDDEAMSRIKGAIADEISLTAPRPLTRTQYRQRVCVRLDAIFAGRQKLGSADDLDLSLKA